MWEVGIFGRINKNGGEIMKFVKIVHIFIPKLLAKIEFDSVNRLKDISV